MAYYIHWRGEGKVPREKIREVEEYLGIRFPEAFVQIVMEHNRGAPLPNRYEFEGPDGSLLDSMISNLIPFSLEKSAEQQEFVRAYYDCLKEKQLPEGVYPFAVGSYIDLTCFDYRNTVDGEPSILWWCDYHEPNHKGLKEGAIYPVYNSFSELLERLDFYFEWTEVRGPIGRERIKEVEQAWDVTLPEDYVQCVMQYNGGRPSPDDRFWDSLPPGKGKKHVFKCLLPYDETGTNILSVYEEVRERIATGVYPIVECNSADYVCLDYRYLGSGGPKIILWEQEEDRYYPVDDMFTGLLASLNDIR